MVRALVLGKVDNLRFPAGDLDHHNTLFIILRIAYCLSKKDKKGFLSNLYLQKSTFVAHCLMVFSERYGAGNKPYVALYINRLG